LVDEYLAQHDVQPVTIKKLRWLLSKALAAFGDRRVGELTSHEIAAWRMTLLPGHRFEATQALRQVLHRATAGMIDANPAKVGVDNPTPRRKEQRPFESWAEVDALADAIGPRYGPMIVFGAATGLRPAEWVALEKRDVDHEERVVYVRRSSRRESSSAQKTEANIRAVPLQAQALEALERLPDRAKSPLLFPGERGGYLDIHHFRPAHWRPAQLAVGIEPVRLVYDLSPHLRDLCPTCRHLHVRPIPLHACKPDDDRPPLRPPRPGRTRPRDTALGRSLLRRIWAVDVRGRSVDVETFDRRPLRERNQRLSRRKPKAL
jgi:integrase